jgi:hypothetical protein
MPTPPEPSPPFSLILKEKPAIEMPRNKPIDKTIKIKNE